MLWFIALMKNVIPAMVSVAFCSLATLFLVINHANAQTEKMEAQTEMEPPYTYKALIVKVYDGDTFTALVDVGFETFVQTKLRLAGVNTPELRGEKRANGLVVRDHVRDLILDQDVLVTTHGKGKYGRWITTVKFRSPEDGSIVNLSDYLLSVDMAVVYE